MALSQRLAQRQSQSLVMTPQLQQAIKLLQYSQTELAAYIEQELERNPLLEQDGDANHEDVATGGAAPVTDAGTGGRQDSEGVDNSLDVEDRSWTDDSPQFGPGPAAFAVGGGTGASHDFNSSTGETSETQAGQISLRDHLIEQINIDIPSVPDRMVAVLLVDYLDEAGYLQTDSADIAAALGCPVAQIDDLIATLQKFDPPGIFARSLDECLALQLRELDRLDPAMRALLDNLQHLADGETETLLRLCGIGSEDLSDMIAELRALNPKPALAFDHTVAQAVQPDIFLRRGRDGAWHVELVSETLPRLIVNRTYYAKVTANARTKTDRDYVVDQLNSANWLVRALHQRATTILKVSTEIVRMQSDFFDKGLRYLKPLVLRDIAEAIEMHESTVSRATANKYISTPRGIFELKYFFTSAIANLAGEEAHSAESVRHRIRLLIDAETSKTVLSDDKIVKLLHQDGVDIARRTVAKYREAMRIPSSVGRRRKLKVRTQR